MYILYQWTDIGTRLHFIDGIEQTILKIAEDTLP